MILSAYLSNTIYRKATSKLPNTPLQEIMEYTRMNFTNQQLTLSDLATPQQDLDKPEEEQINTILQFYCCKEEKEGIKINLKNLNTGP